ncbi:PhnE/PtxC family ABC transporter permease [[Pasteurella] aerogenes]
MSNADNFSGKQSLNERRNLLTGILIMAFLLSVLAVPTEKGIMHTGGWATLQRLITSLLHPDLSADLLKLAFNSSLLTFSYALISLSLALVGAFFLSLFASGILFPSLVLQGSARAMLGFLRAIHELIWAWFFVAAVGLSPIGALVALAIPYTGYLGKIFADILQNVPQKPILALRESGANRWQLLCYGYLPQAMPAMLSYTMYRLECAIRSSSVLSFVGLGGIGMQIQLSLQDLKYEQIWTFLGFLILMIVLIDRWSYAVRRRIK